jgi:hypothetical protein
MEVASIGGRLCHALNGRQLAVANGVIVVSVPLTDLVPGR